MTYAKTRIMAVFVVAALALSTVIDEFTIDHLLEITALVFFISWRIYKCN